ncbi:MAG: hypothetical protein ACI9NC_002520 [Verrucomicrobiales bacterium]|jgi:hypothetical protein
MKYSIRFAALLIATSFVGCSNSDIQSHAKLSHSQYPGLYDVDITIRDKSGSRLPRKPQTIRMSMEEGSETSTVSSSSAKDDFDIACSATVDDTQGTVKAKTSVSIAQEGSVVWSKTETVALPE